MRNALFLCTGNSARSIMAEAYINHVGRDRWRGFSAGSKPTRKPNPFALETLERHGVPVSAHGERPRSKSWNEFAASTAPVMNVVVTVCDNAAGETCPVWPTRGGQAPQKLHWSFPDPAAVKGTDDEKRAAFDDVFNAIRAKIDDFLTSAG